MGARRAPGMWAGLLVGLALVCAARGLESPSSGMAGLLRAEEPPPEGAVEVVRYKPGFDQARTEDDLGAIFRDNLDADMAEFRRQDWTIAQFAEFVLRFDKTVPRHEQGEGNAALVIVRNGTVKVQWLRGKDNHWRMACIEAAINGAKSLRFPDSAFVVNIDDFPVCAAGRCPLPVFTMYKKWGRKRGNIETNEVLMPVFNHHYEDLYTFPWDRKRPKAFMRASQQGCMAPNSTRAVLAVLSEDHPEDLDLGITRIDGAQKYHLKYRFSKAGFVTIEDHTKWKYLVSADGCVAQTRMAKVMLTNSVVLKEESDWIEYYYRSLVPWKHYVPLPPGETMARDILPLVKRLQREDRRAQRIAETAQLWAYR
ncbi:MAG: glycosyl transferase family 90-domain-containing protein [Monoraphidium minutum]|nr:MAG: glycosyl transferase family 90-domain-containing protein [Monoraphidium minutum]